MPYLNEVIFLQYNKIFFSLRSWILDHVKAKSVGNLKTWKFDSKLLLLVLLLWNDGQGASSRGFLGACSKGSWLFQGQVLWQRIGTAALLLIIRIRSNPEILSSTWGVIWIGSNSKHTGEHFFLFAIGHLLYLYKCLTFYKYILVQSLAHKMSRKIQIFFTKMCLFQIEREESEM